MPGKRSFTDTQKARCQPTCALVPLVCFLFAMIGMKSPPHPQPPDPIPPPVTSPPYLQGVCVCVCVLGGGLRAVYVVCTLIVLSLECSARPIPLRIPHTLLHRARAYSPPLPAVCVCCCRLHPPLHRRFIVFPVLTPSDCMLVLVYNFAGLYQVRACVCVCVCVRARVCVLRPVSGCIFIVFAHCRQFAASLLLFWPIFFPVSVFIHLAGSGQCWAALFFFGPFSPVSGCFFIILAYFGLHFFLVWPIFVHFQAAFLFLLAQPRFVFFGPQF